MNTIDKQRMLRTPEYGYAHVWELQQLQGEDPAVHLTGKHVDTIPYNLTTGQTRIQGVVDGGHKYESPQFLRIDNTTLGRVQCQYPEFHHHDPLETQIPVTGRQTQQHIPECEAHPNNSVLVSGGGGGGGTPGQCTTDEQRYTN